MTQPAGTTACGWSTLWLEASLPPSFNSMWTACSAVATSLEAVVLASSVLGRRVVPEDERSVQEVGRSLFEALFTGDPRRQGRAIPAGRRWPSPAGTGWWRWNGYRRRRDPASSGRLLAGEWHVLHFIGHGDDNAWTEQGVLALVGVNGRADLSRPIVWPTCLLRRNRRPGRLS